MANSSLNGSESCDLHYVVVATKPDKFPGAYASCVDEPEFLADWAVEHLLEGATLRRVTCNAAHALLQTYLKWCDKEDAKCDCPCKDDCDEAGECLKAMGMGCGGSWL